MSLATENQRTELSEERRRRRRRRKDATNSFVSTCGGLTEAQAVVSLKYGWLFFNYRVSLFGVFVVPSRLVPQGKCWVVLLHKDRRMRKKASTPRQRRRGRGRKGEETLCVRLRGTTLSERTERIIFCCRRYVSNPVFFLSPHPTAIPRVFIYVYGRLTRCLLVCHACTYFDFSSSSSSSFFSFAFVLFIVSRTMDY